MRPSLSRLSTCLLCLGFAVAPALAQPESDGSAAPDAAPVAEPEAQPESEPEAQPEPAEPELSEEERTTRAREAYGRGVQLYEQELYAEAAAAFDEAYGYVPLPLVLRPLAEAHERAGDIDGAVLALEGFLSHDHPDLSEEARSELEAKLASLKSNPGFLDVYVDPEGAEIVIDGDVNAEAAPTRVELPAGEHVVIVSAEGFLPAERMVRVPYGGYARVEVTMEPEPLPEPEPVEVAPPPLEPLPADDLVEDDVDRGASPAVWALGAVSAAALATGSALGFLALTQESQFDGEARESTADRGEGFALGADIAFGISFATAVTAVALYLAQRPDRDEDELEDAGALDGDAAEAPEDVVADEEASVHWTVAPVVGPTGGGVSAEVRF
ncbi:MAG: PEGA domain-containing protein [Myxococcota bacterium]